MTFQTRSKSEYMVLNTGLSFACAALVVVGLFGHVSGGREGGTEIFFIFSEKYIKLYRAVLVQGYL